MTGAEGRAAGDLRVGQAIETTIDKAVYRGRGLARVEGRIAMEEVLKLGGQIGDGGVGHRLPAVKPQGGVVEPVGLDQGAQRGGAEGTGGPDGRAAKARIGGVEKGG